MISSPRSTGAKRPGLERSTQICGDRLRHGVGLLRCQSTLLERERRDVSGGVDVIDAVDATVAVDGQEPTRVAGKTGDGWSVEQREHDHAVGVQLAGPGELERPPANARRLREGTQADTPSVKQGLDPFRGRRSKQFEWLLLGRHERHLDGIGPVLA